jgi:hypothetical protein
MLEVSGRFIPFFVNSTRNKNGYRYHPIGMHISGTQQPISRD